MSNSEISPSMAAECTIAVAAELTTAVAAHARTVLAHVLAPDRMDDRFDYWPFDESDTGHAESSQAVIAALATTAAGHPVGFLGGSPDRGALRLDVLIAPTIADPANLVSVMYSQLEPVIDGALVHTVELWARPTQAWLPEATKHLGFQPYRQLHQMIGPLDGIIAPVATRPLVVDDRDDVARLVAVNNRAFASHPDQGTLSVDAFLTTADQPWFRADGVRLHERNGQLAGFCWTKIHRYRLHPATPDMGEIYVIAVDPDYHGQGLGAPMTAAGLRWLADQDLSVGMLYVEADNEPAIRTYRRLGFEVVRTDSAWLTSL